MARTEPIRISSPGRLTDQYIVFPLPDGDEFNVVSAECDIEGVTVEDIDPTTIDIVVNGETIPAGRAIQFAFNVAADVEILEGYLLFSYETINGSQIQKKKRLIIRDYLASDDGEIEE